MPEHAAWGEETSLQDESWNNPSHAGEHVPLLSPAIPIDRSKPFFRLCCHWTDPEHIEGRFSHSLPPGHWWYSLRASLIWRQQLQLRQRRHASSDAHHPVDSAQHRGSLVLCGDSEYLFCLNLMQMWSNTTTAKTLLSGTTLMIDTPRTASSIVRFRSCSEV